jgi:hypothetical protein
MLGDLGQPIPILSIRQVNRSRRLAVRVKQDR